MSEPPERPARPPRAARRLLRAALPGDEREALLGDLEEIFNERRRRCGDTKARWWYWRQVLLAPPRVAIERYRARSVVAGPPRTLARRTLQSVTALGADARLGAWRSAQRPAMLVSAVLVLSLAVGGTTALVAALDAFARWEPGVPAPESLQALALTRGGRTLTRHPVGDWLRLRDELPDLRPAAVAHRFVVARAPDGATTVWSAAVDRAFFEIVDAALGDGRAFSADGNEVVISDSFWRQRLNGDDRVVGNRIWVDGAPYTVVGVTEPGFRGMSGQPALWIPLDTLAAAVRETLAVAVLACRCDHPDLDAAAERATEVLTAGRAAEGAETARWIPAADVWIPRNESAGIDRVNAIVATLALLVLASACANVANLLLADGLARRTEMSVRAALGASRGRLLRQLLIESLALGGAVCAASYGVAIAVLAAVPRWLPTPIPGFERELSLPRGMLAAGMLLGLVVTFAASLFPAARLSAGGAARARRGGSHVALELLGGVQVAAATALTLIALFLTAGMGGVRALPLGYDEQQRYSFTLDAGALPDDPAQRTAAYRRFFDELATAPAVAAAAVVGSVPGFLAPSTPVHGDDASNPVLAAALGIGPGYLEAVGTRLVAGRPLRADDAGRNVALVTGTLARALWGTDAAIGRFLRRDGADTPLQVVGVVENGTYASAEALPLLMWPLQPPSSTQAMVVVHARADMAELARLLRAAAAASHADLSMYSLAPVSEWFERHWVLERAVGAIMRTLALLGLVISGIGVYAGFSTLVARRRHELGVRLSIGASPARLVRWILVRSGRVAGAGYLAGVALAIAGSRLVQALLFESGPLDPLPYAVGLAVTLGVSLAAALPPAFRAARVDPARSLPAR